MASADAVRVSREGEAVYKSECVYSFATSHGALYISLASHQAVSAPFMALEAKKTGCGLFLCQRREKWVRAAPEAEATPTKLAIGGPDGFQVEQEESRTTTRTSLVMYPGMEEIAYPFETPIPNQATVEACIAAILDATDATRVQETVSWHEERPISKYAADLSLCDTGFRLPADPSLWKCQESGMTTNLWLNLSTGYIGSGRQQYDGSGGTGAALRHYEETGKRYPLCVKLGTITPTDADVYSYASDEDGMVVDPLLDQHLAHWGVDRNAMVKTEKSMEELQVDANLKLDMQHIQEEGSRLEPASGPLLWGLVNLGNSCYVNAVLQLLIAVPELRSVYKANASTFQQASDPNAAHDICVQMSKLMSHVERTPHPPTSLTQTWSPWTPPPYLAPSMLRNALGRQHPDFSSTRQQDAHEYLQHVLDQLHRAEHARSVDVSSPLFSFDVEERIECCQSNRIKYTRVQGENTLTLPIPLVSTSDHHQTVSFDSCLASWLKAEPISGFYSSATKQRGDALKQTRLASFPPYLVIKMQRYVVGPDWTPTKIDALVSFPTTLDLAAFRALGKQEHEVELPDEQLGVDPALVSQLTGMGFSEHASARALLASNGNLEAATDWILQHMSDPGLDDPVQTDAPSEAAGMLMAMGYSRELADRGLQQTDNDPERAVEWLCSHPVDGTTVQDGAEQYRLVGFLSHIGKGTHHGHYVAHLRHKEQWYLFNDRRVAKSQHPPLDRGYVYLFQRSFT